MILLVYTGNCFVSSSVKSWINLVFSSQLSALGRPFAAHQLAAWFAFFSSACKQYQTFSHTPPVWGSQTRGWWTYWSPDCAHPWRESKWWRSLRLWRHTGHTCMVWGWSGRPSSETWGLRAWSTFSDIRSTWRRSGTCDWFAPSETELGGVCWKSPRTRHTKTNGSDNCKLLGITDYHTY